MRLIQIRTFLPNEDGGEWQDVGVINSIYGGLDMLRGGHGKLLSFASFEANKQGKMKEVIGWGDFRNLEIALNKAFT